MRRAGARKGASALPSCWGTSRHVQGLRHGAVALLVLLAAATRARRVAWHLVRDRLRRRPGIRDAATALRLVAMLLADALRTRGGGAVSYGGSVPARSWNTHHS